MRSALLAVLMCLAVPGQGRAAELAAADKDAIRELLVRHYLKDWRQKPLVFLVFDKDTDPPDAFGRLWGYGGTFIVEKADSRWKILEEARHW
jgi:hypothetical protein